MTGPLAPPGTRNAAFIRHMITHLEALKLMSDVVKTTNDASTFEAAIQSAVDRICEHTGWPIGHLYLASPTIPGLLVPTRIWHLDDPEKFATFKQVTETASFTSGKGLPGRVMSSGSPAWITDVREDPNFPRAKMAKDIGVKAAFAFPLLVRKEVTGVLEFFVDEPVPPDPMFLETLAQIGALLGRAVERTRAEQQYEQLLGTIEGERALLEAIVRQMPMGVGIVSAPKGHVLFMNEQASTIFGKRTPPSVGGHPSENWKLYHLDGREYERHERPLERAITRGEVIVSENIKIFREDGSEGTICVNAAPVYDQNGHRIAAVVTFVDATESMAREEESERRISETKDSLRFREELIGVVSHDLKSPLSAIRMNAEVILSQFEIGSRTFKHAKLIIDAVHRMERMIHDLLDLAKVEAPGFTIKPEIWSAEILIKDALEAFQSQIKRKEISVRWNLTPEVGGCKTRCERFRAVQILSNLLSNAIKFSPAGSLIEISAECSPREVVFSVHDQGPGIPTLEQARLFRRFSRGSARSSTEGTGLGLYIAKTITQAHGGRIWIESAEGKGSTFRFTLPRSA